MFLNGYSQNMFDYEQEINNKENYNFQELDFQNTEENIKLSGTLLTPKTNYDKIVIIVPGSGRDTRYAHFILAEEFLKNGIAVYRFDERGIGKSEGQFNTTATSLTDDLTFALWELRKLDFTKSHKIGVLGHSLGGIASIGAYENNQNIDFLIQMGTPVEKYGAFFKYQTINDYFSEFYQIKGKTQEQVVELLNLIYPIIVSNDDFKTIRVKAKKIAKENGFKKDFYKFISPTHIDLVKQNYEETYKNINIPVLYIIGGNDKFVNPKSETEILKSFNNTNIQIKIMDGLNHWLTEKNADAGTSLYQMDTSALKGIINWTLNK
jgi:alpha-beta hydrolase superfamily lysophospholipase